MELSKRELTGKSREGIRQFSDACWLPAEREQVFRFFCDPENLERITPPWLHFRVLRQSTPRIEQGTEFEYRLRIHAIPVRWVSRIESWLPGREFTDVQISGPYALWHHTHRFEDRDGGTLMTDRVRFRLPGGSVGNALAGAVVHRDVRKIFQHRKEAISALFAECIWAPSQSE
jgi:ligand-binding SRPBCC domain-containing protein